MKYTFPCLLVLLWGTAAAQITIDGGAVSNEPETADQHLNDADSVFKQRDLENALSMYHQALKTARDEFNRSVEVESLSQIARVYLSQNNPDEGRLWLEKAEERADDAEPMGWSRYLGVRGRFEWKDKELPKALKTFDAMYVYCNTNGLFGRSVDAANMLAIVSESPEDRIAWSRRGIDAAETGGEDSWLGPLCNNLGVTYFEIGEYDSALTAFRNARDYHWRFSGEVAKLFADYHVGMTYRRLGQMDEAASWLRPVLAWAERLDNQSAIGQACEDLGEVEIARGNKAEGLKLLKRAREAYRVEDWENQLPEVWKNLNKRIDALGG
jgi:tetratricopeptide (TPR) repeat protein